MDLLEELVRIAEECGYPEQIEISAAHMKLVCNFSNAEYAKARAKLIELKLIKAYDNPAKALSGTYTMNYSDTPRFSTGMRI